MKLSASPFSCKMTNYPTVASPSGHPSLRKPPNIDVPSGHSSLRGKDERYGAPLSGSFLNEDRAGRSSQISYEMSRVLLTRPRSAVGNVSGYRNVSICRTRGREFFLPLKSHTFVEFDHEIISAVILLFMKDCCQL